MKRLLFLALVSIIGAGLTIVSCVHKPQIPVQYGNFPASVGQIFVNKCAVSGCHNAASYHNCDDLLLDSWEHLFQGSQHGAVVVAYCTKYSPLLYYCNTDATLGTVAKPTMPFSTTTNPQNPLSKAEYTTLANWIACGAPDANGNIPFASNPDTRQKIYVTQQGCNLLAVIDGQSKQIMRYITLDTATGEASQSSPHGVTVSHDGMNAYVPFISGAYLDKIDTRTDKIVAYANIGATLGSGTGSAGGWSIVAVAPQDTSLMVTGYYCNNVVNVSTATMTVNQRLSIDQRSGYPASNWAYPHGVTSNATFDTFFVAEQWGNIVAKYTFDGAHPSFKFIGVNGQTASLTSPADSMSPDPHFIQMAPDFSKYFVTCQGTSKVAVIDAHTDSIITTIDVGAYPQEIAIYPAKNEIFVACLQDAANPTAGALGSIYVIDINTYQVKGKIYGDFYQPHDMAVDAQDGYLYVISTNYSPGGPPPHHVTGCGPRAGWYSVYDLNTFQPVDGRRYEMTYYPYAAATRFH